MSYRLLAEATQEFRIAVDYYESVQPGLGLSFLDDFEQTMKNVQAYPEAWTPVSSNLRRCLFRHFPYAVLYACEEDMILVAAVMHLHKSAEDFFRGR